MNVDRNTIPSSRCFTYHTVLNSSEEALRPCVSEEFDVSLCPAQSVTWMAGVGHRLHSRVAVQPQKAHLDQSCAWIIELENSNLINLIMIMEKSDGLKDKLNTRDNGDELCLIHILFDLTYLFNVVSFYLFITSFLDSYVVQQLPLSPRNKNVHGPCSNIHADVDWSLSISP